jgi:hypothetical protein
MLVPHLKRGCAGVSARIEWCEAISCSWLPLGAAFLMDLPGCSLYARTRGMPPWLISVINVPPEFRLFYSTLG